MHTLLVVSEDASERSVTVDPGQGIIAGRAEGCELYINDRRLSRRHARFFVEGGRLFVEDLGGPNGTHVNGKRVSRAELSPGDTIVLGKTQLRVPPGPSGAPVVRARGPSDTLTPTHIKPLERAPEIGGMRAEDYFSALGLGDETLLEPDKGDIATLLKRTRSFAILADIAKAIQREHDANQMLDRVLDILLKVTRGDRGHAALLDHEGALGSFAVRRPGGRLPPGAPGTPAISVTVTRHVIDARCAVICTDSRADARFQDSESLMLDDIRSLMAVPIIVGNRVLGLIEIASSHLTQGFEESDLDLLSVVASTVGVALDNLRLAADRERTIHELEAAQAQLVATQERLIRSEQLAAIGRFATGIAHEVKNHLSPFMLAQLLAEQYPDDTQIQEAAQMMIEAQQHILDLTNQIRGFARGAADEAERSPQDLAEVVEAVLRFMSHDAGVRKAKVSQEIESRPLVELDPRSFRQVLVNLIRNAADALPERGGSITVRVTSEGDRGLIEVIDEGTGIPPEIAARIFDPFFSTKGERGLGLGLDISRKIVRAHGGELSFETEVGRGTTFRISLPAARL
jgi:signal transduction histidine kinase